MCAQISPQLIMLCLEYFRISDLCDVLEKIFYHGIKTNYSLANLTDFFLKTQSYSHANQFWSFVSHHMTPNEKQRYNSLKHVWTDKGKNKSFIRNCLNEQSLGRYCECFLFGEIVNVVYEDWAVMRDERSGDLLPKLANDLTKILFAIQIDSPDFNVQTSSINIKVLPKSEPIIVSPIPSSSNHQDNGVKKEKALIREIVSFDETSSHSSDASPLPVLAASQKQEAQSFFENFHNGVTNHIEEDFLARNRLSSSSSSSSISLSSENISVKSSASSRNFQEDFGSSASFLPPACIPKISESTEKLTNIIIDKSIQEKMKKQDDHIFQLEKTIADLILENSRLKSLLNHKVNPLSNFIICIPQAVLVKSKTKNYYVYEIHIKARHGRDDWSVMKRYSDFYKLHKKLKKEHIMIKTLDFPKKNIINMDFEFVEQRRQRLQVYMR